MFDSLHIFAVGRVFGPTHIVRTTNGGVSWRSTALSPLMEMAIDCYFWSPDSGIVVGGDRNLGIETPTRFDSTSASIILTTDGGETWREVHRTQRLKEWCWKISFPSSNIGYVSIESRRSDSLFVLKTTDKGQTWSEQLVTPTSMNVQGIGFVTDSIGFLSSSTGNGFRTTDGGNTWLRWNNNHGGNRYQFFGDSIGFVVGKRVAKLTVQRSRTIREQEKESVKLVQTREGLRLELDLEGSAEIYYEIFDVLGRQLSTSDRTFVKAGRSVLELPKVPSRAIRFLRAVIGAQHFLFKY